MGFPTFAEKYGSLSATGVAKEVTFGTAVTANEFLPMDGNTMEEDPGWFAPHLMQGYRDYQVYNLYGEAKYTGAVTGPLFPANAIEFLSASIGADGSVGWGVAAPATTPTSTTLNGATTAGATSITVTSGTGFAIGQQVDVDVAPNQEFRLISNVSGSTVTLADGLSFAHATGVAVSTGTTTTTSASSTAGATSITVTSATGLAVGNTIQIDVNSVSGSTTSEIRKISTIVSTTITLDVALVYAHASGVQVTVVSAPFTHTLVEQNSLPSLTVEKNLGGFQSLQFAGCRVGKFDIKVPTGNSPAGVTIDLSGQSVTTLSSPTAISISTESPYVFAEASLTMFGSARTEVSNCSVTIDNGLKETYTYSGNHGPSFITPVTLHVNGTIDLVWDSLTDATYGDFNRMANGTLGALTFMLQHPTNGGTVVFHVPQIVLNKFANDLKMEDVIMSSLSYEATRPLTGSTLYTIQVQVANSAYVAY